MRNTRTAALLVIGLTLGLAPIVDAATRICAEQEAISAEMEADSLKTWAQVFAAYKQYRQCDDGGIAEGYSDSIATLLAERWDQLKTLMTLIRTDPKFETFVLRHVDATMSLEQSKTIEANVRLRCPRGANQLCVAIRRALDDAH